MPEQIKGLDKLFATLGKAAAQKTLVRPMHEATQHVETILKHYPSKHGNAPVEFVSEKQRRYFFWALNNGKIEVPYKRGRTLGNSWTTKVSKRGAGLIGVIGTDIPYAPLVQWHKTQARRFRGIWTTTDDVVKSATVRRRVDRVFQRAIDKALGGK